MKTEYLLTTSADNRFFVSWHTTPDQTEYAYTKIITYSNINFVVRMDVEAYQSKVWELVSFGLALFTMLKLKAMSGVWNRTTKTFDIFNGEPVSTN